MAGIEVHIPYVNFKTNVQGFPRRVNGQAEQVNIQQNLQYMGKKIKMIPSIQPLNTADNIQWSIIDGSIYASIDSSTGELTINNNAITQMIKVKATSLTNSSIFDEREIVLTYKDIDEIDLPVYQIIVTGLEDEYIFINNERTYTLKFSEYPGTIGGLFFDIIEGQNFINISDISSVDNNTYITFSFMNIIDETNVIKLHVFDYEDNTIETTVNIIVKAKVQNIGFINIPNGNIIPDIVYSFDYYTDPVLQRSMDVSIVQNNNLIDSYYLSNVNGTSGTINFVRKNEEIGQNQDVVFRVSDAQDLTNYRDASIVFAPIANHRIDVYDNLPVYEYDPSTNVYYSFRWQEVPAAQRELSVQVIEPSTGSITYNLTDVSFGSGKFNFRPNSVNDEGNFTVKIYDEDNPSFYTDVNFLVHNTVRLYNSVFKLYDFNNLTDIFDYNNYGENYFVTTPQYVYIPNFANDDIYNIINIKKYYGNNHRGGIIDKKINFEMRFSIGDAEYYQNDIDNVEILNLTNITDSNDVSVLSSYNVNFHTYYKYLSGDITHINGDNIQIKVKVSLNTGEYKIYETNVQFLDLSNETSLYITDNIRDINGLSSILMEKSDEIFPIRTPEIEMKYLYDVNNMYVTLQNGNIDDYLCIAFTWLPLDNAQNGEHIAFILDKKNNRFIYNVNDLKDYIKRNNSENSNHQWIPWAYDTNGHIAYDIELAENRGYNKPWSQIEEPVYFALFEKNSFTLTNRLVTYYTLSLNGLSGNASSTQYDRSFRNYTVLDADPSSYYGNTLTMDSLETTNTIGLGRLDIFELADNQIIGNIPNNFFTGNIIVDNYYNEWIPVGSTYGQVIKITKTKKLQVPGGSTVTFNKSDLDGFTGNIRIWLECNYNILLLPLKFYEN